MGFEFHCALLTTIFALSQCSVWERPVEAELVDCQLGLFEDVVIFTGSLSDDVSHFMEKIASKNATAEEVERGREVEEKLATFKDTMFNLLKKNNVFIRNLFAAVYPEEMESGTPSIKLGKNVLTHGVEIKRLIAYHVNHEGMEVWKLLGNTFLSDVGENVLSSNHSEEY